MLLLLQQKLLVANRAMLDGIFSLQRALMHKVIGGVPLMHKVIGEVPLMHKVIGNVQRVAYSAAVVNAVVSFSLRSLTGHCTDNTASVMQASTQHTQAWLSCKHS